MTGSQERADAVDALIVANLTKVSDDPNIDTKGWALAAVGGYGRRRLAPFSDIDLVLVHSRLKPAQVKILTQSMFYPLWDARLNISHTVRSIREAVLAAGDINWLTSSLDARFLGGDQEVFNVFVAKMTAVVAARGARPFIKTIVSAAESRWSRFGHAGRLLAPNIKDSRGGLRDIQTIGWAAKALAGAGAHVPLDERDKERLAEAEEFLWEVRVRLHEISGKCSDVLLDEYREKLSDSSSRSFDTRFYGLTRAVAHIYDTFFSGLTGGRKVPAAKPGVQALFEALRNAEKGIGRLEELAYSGQLSLLMPPWREIEALAAPDANHLYTVDIHSFYTVMELSAGFSADGDLAAAMRSDIIHYDWLLLGGLLHDIGKGRGGSHADIGEALTEDIASGLKLDRHGQETISFLVGNHLLLSKVATRRDLNDKHVINSVAAAVGDSERLKMLYLLTIADAKATGPGAWNAWRAALIKELFLKVLSVLEGDSSLDSDQQIVLKEKHFDLLSNSEKTQIVLWPGTPGLSELAVVAPDRPGLFNRIAGALALSGLSILAAQIYTTGDGRALEVFKVTGVFEPEVTPELFDRAREAIIKTISGRLALPYHIDELAKRYRKPARAAAPRVVIDNVASDNYTIIEIHAADEIGLLYKLTGALLELNLDVHLAKISTYGDEAVDVFYVLEFNGQKIVEAEHLREIEKNVLFRLTHTGP